MSFAFIVTVTISPFLVTLSLSADKLISPITSSSFSITNSSAVFDTSLP